MGAAEPLTSTIPLSTSTASELDRRGAAISYDAAVS